MDKENKVYIRRQLGASPEGEQDGQYIALNKSAGCIGMT